MRILMLSDVYFPRVNGVSTSIRTHARDLVDAGHEVTLVAPAYETAARDDDEPFEILRLPSRRIFFDPEDRLIRERALRRMRTILAARAWDVVHIHTPFQAHRLGVWLARDSGVATVESYHTYFEQYVGHYLPWLPAALTRWSARALSQRLCGAVDHLIVPSQQMVDVLAGYGIATPRDVIPTGIDLAEFSRGDGAAFRAAHGIAATRTVLVTVSRLAREKNIGFLLEVVQRLQPQFPELLLVIAGEGPDATRLRELASTLGIEANVRFFGNLDRRGALLDCYRAGNAFVFASPTETQGLVLIEAMALGVPIVSTAVMGTASVLHDAASASIADEDVDDFVAKVGAVLRDPARAAAMSQAGALDAARWSSRALVQRVEALYLRLATTHMARVAANA